MLGAEQRTKTVMSDELSNDSKRPNPPEDPAPRVPDERDLAIERLKRAVVDERRHSKALRETVEALRGTADSLRESAEALRHEVEALEKNYSAQLADACSRREAAEKKLAEQQVSMAKIDSAREDALRLLYEAHTELEQIAAERAQLPQAPASGDDRQAAAVQEEPESELEEATINKLLDASQWPDKQQSQGRDKIDHQARAQTEEASEVEDMLAPELLMSGRQQGDGNA
jgi:chromosome segregation ATPase